jgi:hypothetical protein
MGIIPFTSSLVEPTRHASKEWLHWQAHCESLKGKKLLPAVGTKVGKKVHSFYLHLFAFTSLTLLFRRLLNPATVETEPESSNDKSVSDEVSATAPANKVLFSL